MGDTRGPAGHRSLHRFFVEPESVTGQQVRFSPLQWRQMTRVLRLSEGNHVTVCDGSGREYLAVLCAADSFAGTIVETAAGRTEPR